MTDRKKVRLNFFSETGTEGGWWAAQDYEHITPAPDEAVDQVCENCGFIWPDYKHTPELGPRDYTWRDSKGNMKSGTKLPRNTRLGKEPFDIYYIESNKSAHICNTEGHQWKDYGPHERWSYEGLIMLQTGDVLEILDNDENVTETITCHFLSNEDQYAPGAKSAMGMVIHGYQDPSITDEDHWNELFMTEKTDAYLTQAEKS